MKRIAILSLLSLLLVLCLAGCSCSDRRGSKGDREDEETTSTDTIGPYMESHSHVMSEWAVFEEASCIKNGTMVRECLTCGEYEETIQYSTDEHVCAEAVKENEVFASCQSQGSYDMVVYCTLCGESVESETVITEKTDHKPSRLNATGEYCNGVQVSEVLCGDCGAYITSYGHKYEETSVLPTCTEDGYVRTACAVCGDSETRVIEAFGHMGAGWETVTAASCVSEGYIVSKCMLCQTVIEEAETSRLEHAYVAAVTDASLTYTCVACSHSYTEEIDDDIYTVDFVTNGGSECQSIVVKAGDTVNLPDITKDGFCLSGWYYDNEEGVRYVSDPIYGDTTLYACWQEAESASFEDHAIELSVGLDFAFDVVIDKELGEGDIYDYICVYDLTDNRVNIEATYKGNGIYTVTSNSYENGNYYYAAVKSPARFTDTEQTEKQFTTKGEDRYNIVLNSTVDYLDSLDVYGIIEDGEQAYILSAAELTVGKNVAIYESTKDNIKSVIRILSKNQMYGFNAYAFEMADYEAVFDSFEMNTSVDVSFESFELDSEAEEAIKEQFMSSPLYYQAKGAAEMLATVEGTVLENTKVKFKIYENGDDVVTEITLEFRFKKAYRIKVIVENRLNIHSEAYVHGVGNYAFVTTNTLNTRIHIEGSVSLSDEFFETGNTLVPKEGQTYADLIDKYKELFDNNEYDQIGLADKKGDAKKYIRLGKVKTAVNGIVIYAEVGFDVEFFFGGVFGAEVNIRTVETTGIRNGNKIDDKSIELSSVSIFAKGKAEINPKLVLEIGANVCGLIFYMKGDVGPYLDAGLAGALVFNGHRFIKPAGSMYLEIGHKYSLKLGVKYQIELWGYKLKLFDFNVSLIEKKEPKFSVGESLITIGFANYEDPISKTHKCDEDVEISLDAIDTRVLVQDFSDLKTIEKNSNAQMYISHVSGYSSCISLKNKTLYINNVPEEVTVTVSVKYNEVITKEIVITVSAEHPSDCIHMKCTEHTGGMLTCTSKAICEVCGLEYGDEPKGHVWGEYICSVCGEYKGSEGIEYTLSWDETYYIVTGIGTCYETDVIISSSYFGLPVKSIDAYSFYGCKNLTSITMQNGITDIGNSAFYGCTNLTSVTIPSSVASIGGSAFYACPNLSYNEIDNALYLGNEENPYFALIKAKNVGITSCNVTKKTKFICSNAFEGCEILTDVTIPNNVTDIGSGAFINCKNLTHITLPKGITTIGYRTFYNCNSLKNVTIPEGVTRIEDDAFKICKSLTSINIPSSVTYIGEWVFDLCDSLNAIYITDLVSWCNIEFDEDNANPLVYGKNLYLNGLLVTNLVIPEGVTNIGKYAFQGCKSIVSVVMPEGLDIIGHYAFLNCDNISSITIPRTVRGIFDEAFRGCDSLTSIIIPNSVVYLGYAVFYSCDSLTVYFENNISTDKWNDQWSLISLPTLNTPFYISSMVWNCNNNDATSGGLVYTVIDDIRYVIKNNVATITRQAKNIKNVNIPKSIEYKGVSYSITIIEDEAFKYCDKLESIEIPNNITSIGMGAFKGCPNLTSVTFEKGSQVTSIYQETFYECENLTNVILPNSVTGIGQDAFHDCSNLKSIVIPSSVTRIGYKAFSGFCDATIYCEAEREPDAWNDYWNSAKCPVKWGYTG